MNKHKHMGNKISTQYTHTHIYIYIYTVYLFMKVERCHLPTTLRVSTVEAMKIRWTRITTVVTNAVEFDVLAVSVIILPAGSTIG